MLGIILGSAITIILTITIEFLRTPKLSLHLAAPIDMVYHGGPAVSARFLGIECRNSPPPWIVRWVSRSAALQCHGFITFHHLDGQNVFGRPMPIRWSGSTEPIQLQLTIGNQTGYLTDPARMTAESRVDIHPGESGRLDVAAKFDNDSECYGWSNLSYFSNPAWRNPDWKLNSGRYLVKITVLSSSRRCTGVFRLVNDLPRGDTRIEKALSTDFVD